MSTMYFLQTFTFMIIIGSLLVTGWFFITRGFEQIMPDGNIYRYGKVFKGWYFFWNKKKIEKQKIYYTGKQLSELVVNLQRNDALKIQLYGNAIRIGTGNGIDVENLYTSSVSHGFKVFDKGDNVFALYKEYDDYVYPWWVRDPLANCATCFASLYGTIAYWTFIALSKESLFYWSSHPVIASITFWVAFCLSIAVINTALAKKFN